jgi:hypothetical protein
VCPFGFGVDPSGTATAAVDEVKIVPVGGRVFDFKKKIDSSLKSLIIMINLHRDG